ncbi:acetolactate decarboxylase [Paenibacillus thailandensis]|uniref:Alpha-acetolactate decarboxylase n=1 Tax=Paenibacillus thailandensis TaxID=393250 RepID=A0ABW5R2B5_9BACL
MKKKHVITAVAAIGASAILLTGAFANGKADTSASKIHNNTLFQYSTINALMKGQFDGEMTLGEVKKHGDTGLGTFNAVNGELTLIDGKFYRFDYEGHFEEVKLDEKTPFVAATYFSPEKTIEVSNVTQISDLTAQLSASMDKKNNFYAFKVHGTFSYLKVRSEEAQEKPYPTLPEVLAHQSEFEYENVTGTMIAFYTPNYAAMFNVPGFHFHFVSDDRTIGGHILNAKLFKGVAQVDSISNLDVSLPQTEEFANADLTTVTPEEIEAVETDSK